jgi:hypothetical protein
MKKTLPLLILLISEPCLAGEYSDCILENMKGVNDRFAASQIKIACKENALPFVPAKCKKLYRHKTKRLGRKNYHGQAHHPLMFSINLIQNQNGTSFRRSIHSLQLPRKPVLINV